MKFSGDQEKVQQCILKRVFSIAKPLLREMILHHDTMKAQHFQFHLYKQEELLHSFPHLHTEMEGTMWVRLEVPLFRTQVLPGHCPAQQRFQGLGS